MKICWKMSLREIRRKALKKDNDIFSYLFRYISTIITAMLVNTKVTPLQVTWVHLIIGIIAAFLFSFGKYNLTIIAAFLFILSYILDLVDGELARYKEIRSEVSIWLDHVSDYISLFFIILGIAIGDFRNSNSSLTLILALISLTLLGGIGVINISKRSSNKIKQIKAIKLPISFKWSKRLHLGIFTISFLIFVIGPLLKQIKLMFMIYIVIAFFAMIMAFYHRIKLIKLEFNE